MNVEAQSVNISLEQAFFTYYHEQFDRVIAIIDEFKDGEISESELVKEMEYVRQVHTVTEAKLMDQYEYLKKNYPVGGLIQRWYRRLAR